MLNVNIDEITNEQIFEILAASRRKGIRGFDDIIKKTIRILSSGETCAMALFRTIYCFDHSLDVKESLARHGLLKSKSQKQEAKKAVSKQPQKNEKAKKIVSLKEYRSAMTVE